LSGFVMISLISLSAWAARQLATTYAAMM
jgi:hypothetical protein